MQPVVMYDACYVLNNAVPCFEVCTTNGRLKYIDSEVGGEKEAGSKNRQIDIVADKVAASAVVCMLLYVQCVHQGAGSGLHPLNQVE